jgi:THO complex subunit 4
MLTYGPTGRSRGTATIIFVKAGSAAQAAHELNGVKVDNRAMKVRFALEQPVVCHFTDGTQIEVVVGAKSVPAAAMAKSLGDRIA